MSKFNIVGLNYVTLYPADHTAALAYYTQVFGPSDKCLIFALQLT